ncbi:L-tyrosine 3-hydroxylase [Streptomyces sp. JJ66]|uniref:L-tyrosine 3-hydroxylase n=1 Tax=Streptomyces sp. JJ66 TaxID=2803843 RepID=UPI001C59FA92|nr:L-tyrosine 3-hydroxylase [Streptomyces sp. JJ66]MBW1600573.1 L-tyrosine 3-hydroxylase [Streptomyces sp. JJ66]
MSALTSPPRTTAQPVAAWDFGDFPYGLEPLVMPPVGQAPADAEHQPLTVPPCDPERVCVELSVLSGQEPAGPALLAAPPIAAYDQLFWFRWITGHQVTFALWHLTGRLIAEASAHGAPQPGVLERLETYTHAYCAMLLYSGSCPRGVYQSLIRPVMFLQHRAFSGTWAPDFAPVRALYRGRPLPWLNDERAAGLRAAIDTHRAVHDSVAARLVPSGHSLLQQTMAQTPVRPSERTAALYDNFFMTLRGPVSDAAVAAQLLRRLRAVALDLAGNGLYPLGRDDDAEVWHGSVAACERRIGAILPEAARHAARLVDGPKR